VKINTGSANIASYVDDNYGAAGQIMVRSDAYPVASPESLDLGLVNDGVNSATFDFGNV
jgi:hypothetical protein